MPFVSQERREAMSLGGSPETAGELTYLAYQVMIGLWRANRRWTQAHDIKKMMRSGAVHEQICGPRALSEKYCGELDTAIQLAWEVFFIKEVMPYEDEKEAENGGI